MKPEHARRRVVSERLREFIAAMMTRFTRPAQELVDRALQRHATAEPKDEPKDQQGEEPRAP